MMNSMPSHPGASYHAMALVLLFVISSTLYKIRSTDQHLR